ncbi:non-ribosomal peptide synthetase [Streptomyces sp. NBC_01789]|uniref:non-ribosomal peptide synthetase n=1 Tax=Streptomyces sp. NBC_01789 TaxID=2975941 RepID=UPI0022585857|nr:non-ribosomal peptide synthetase [Streptomyces sp. NBC_01789]MCX4448251.1 amino acid adenylation domain-containing protein [Streptomyces sp. NBC_01789]
MHEPAHSLVDILHQRATHQGDDIAYTFVDGALAHSLTYADLFRRAEGVARELRAIGVPGDRALLLCPPGLDFVAAMFGCMMAGFVAVPTYPQRAGRSDSRLAAVVADARPRAALTTRALLRKLDAVAALPDSIARIALDAPAGLPPTTAVDRPDPAAPALLQYTSGSTASPRGVTVTHANLLHNSRIIGSSFETDAHSHAVIWLPSYHDMGLIGGIFQPLYAGFPVTLMAPLAFLQSPFAWLRQISETGATVSGGPNFAYDLCVQRVTEEELGQLDLSSWRVAFNGAEPVRAETLERFAERFSVCGFRPEAFLPCYGLAESTLLVSSGESAAAPVIRCFDRDALAGSDVRRSGEGGSASARLVGAGRPRPELDVRIVDPGTRRPSPPGRVGEIWVSGPSVAAGGYWNQPELSAETFEARLADGTGTYLRTGDLGFLDEGELFVTGRQKDLVIIRGRNHYPQDIEESATRAHPALRPDGAAAFSVDESGEERLVVVHEVEVGRDDLPAAEIAAAVRRQVLRDHELPVFEVVLVRSRSVPRTTSGKVQRGRCKQRHLAGELLVVARHRLDVTGPGPAGTPSTDSGARAYEEIRSAPAGERRDLLASHARGLIVRTLGLPGGDSEISDDSSLADLGLDSLRATQLQHAVETDLDVLLPLPLLLDGPTVGEIIDRLAGLIDAPDPQRLPSPAAAPEGTRHPLSAGQSAMWFLQRLAPDTSAYTIACALRIPAAVDVEALRGAFETLVRRHPILRTTYETVAGRPVQVVGDAPVLDFVHHDAKGWSGSRVEEALSRAADRPFDLANGPVLRAELFSQDADEHVLLIAVHHIAADFWSVEVLLTELGVLYDSGTEADLPGPGSTYAGYAAWQAGLVQGRDGDVLWDYWKRALGGTLPVLDLPTDRPRPAVQTYSGSIHRFGLDADLTTRLRALAERYGVTLYTVLLASYSVLLHRYSGQSDIVVGSPLAARSRAALSGLVGHLTNTVPLRVDLSGDPTFEEVVGRTREVALQALAHQDFPFAAMVERLGLARDASRTPVFQVSFTFQQTHLSGDSRLAALAFGDAGLNGAIGSLPVESVPLPRRSSQFDISLHLAETGADMAGSMIYNTDLFDERTIEGMSRHLGRLLDGIVADPLARISAFPMVGTEELPPSQDAPPEGVFTPVTRLIEAQAARSPGAVAVIDAAGEWTYGQLNTRANRLAGHVRAKGATRGSRVAIMLRPGVEQVVAVLAVLKADATYVPVDPAYPADRVRFLMADANVDVVLTHSSVPVEHVPSEVTVLHVDGEDLDSYPDHDPATEIGPDDLACVIYTSGSTGQPKGVMMSHAGVALQVRGLSERLGVDGRDRHLLAQSLAFAASLRQLTLPLTAGGSVVIADSSHVSDVLALFRLVKDHGVTVMSLNPSYWRHCLEALGRVEPERRRELLDNRLRLLLSASEPLPPAVPRWWKAELGPGVRFVNMLGHTEVSGIATTYDVPDHQDNEPASGSAVLVGKPLPGITVSVLNSSLEPVPVGAAGEMCLSGPALTQGYLNRPDLSADRLVPDPRADRPGTRLYRTGDLVRLSPDGTIRHLGRIDDQLKIRGFRIEPGEVEAALERHPSVGRSIVTAHGDGDRERRLVAHVVPLRNQVPTASELRRHLAGELPEYLIPAAFVLLDALPLNPNGKVDRRALSAPQDIRPTLDEEYVAPGTPTEEAVAGIWQEVLAVDRVGVHDSFFDLGGTSLSITTVHQLLVERLGVELPVAKMFQYPTVHMLALHLDDGQGARQVERARATAGRRRDRLAATARRRPQRRPQKP